MMASHLRPGSALPLGRRGLLAIRIMALAIVFLIPSLTLAQGFQQGFDFRNTANFLTDPPGNTYALPSTTYPTTVNGVTFGWTTPSLVQARDRSTSVDQRLAGINFVNNGAPATFYVDLPSAGTYGLSLAMGVVGYEQCYTQCQVQFLDGGTVLATVTGGSTNYGYFYDTKGNNWSAATWPTSNLSQQVTLAGTRLTVVVGTSTATRDLAPIAFLGVTQVSAAPNFALSASPAALSIQQGNQGTSTITTAISGGFNSSISLSASGMPTGTTVSFNPSTMPAPGAGSSTMTITVGSSTPVGTYPITVTGNGGGTQQNATVNLMVASQGYNYDIGIDFRGTQNYVADPAYAVFDNCVNDGTTQQTRTNANGYSITWQWSQNCNGAADQNNSVDPRLAGIASVYTASGGETLTITVPQPGTYNIGFATGMAAGNQCGAGKCPNFIFKDGASGTQLFTVNPNNPGIGDFIDAANNNWTAAQWPASNQEQTVTLTGTTLTVSMASGNAPSIAHIRITSAQQTPNFTISASPASLGVAQGNQGTSTITTTISGGFNSALSLSALGVPSGTTVSFNPDPIPAPGSGNSTMTITVGSSTPTGTYPITVVGNGGGVQQTTAFALTVTAGAQPNFTISASSASLSVQQGNQGTSTITTTISGGFNSSISLSATGTPTGTTVSFNPSTIPAPGAGNSPMTITVGSSTPVGTYPITVTGNGGGKQHTATVNLLVTPQAAFTLSALPASLNVTQGNQGTSTLTTTISGGFNSAISLSASGVPTGTTVSFNPNPIAAPSSGNSTMTITVGSSTPAGTYPITVTGNGGGIQQTSTMTLTVTAPPNFTLSVSPASLSVAQGNQGTSTITTTISGGFNSTISLAASGTPSGTTVSFNPNPIPAPGSGSSTMTITVASSTPTGTYPITVTGNGGGIQQTTTVTLTVVTPPNFAISASPASLSIAKLGGVTT